MDEAKLWAEFNSASAAVKTTGAAKTSGGVEQRYAIAYQKLVRAGLAPQIRAKYRRL